MYTFLKNKNMKIERMKDLRVFFTLHIYLRQALYHNFDRSPKDLALILMW